MNPHRIRFCIALVALTIIAAFSTLDLGANAETPQHRPTAPALATAKTQAAPGLIATFKSAAGGSDTRHARLAALYVPVDAPPTPFLPAGPFQADLEGHLVLRLRDEITFPVAGAGAVKLLVNDALVLDRSGDLSAGEAARPIRLAKGKNKLVIHYESPKQGDAWFRLYWSAGDFPAEPIPPGQFS